MNLAQKLISFLPYKPHEAARVGILILFSICIGVYFSFYYSYANAIFLSNFDISDLPLAFLCSGFAGIIVSFLYSDLIRRMTYTKMLVSTFGFITLFFLFLRYGAEFNVSEKSLAFIGFIFIPPIIGLNTLIFWGVTMKLFDLREGKRLFGFISAGEVIAGLFGFLSVPMLIDTGLISNSANFLVLSAVGVGIATIVLFSISRKYKNELDDDDVLPDLSNKEVKEKKSLAKFWKNKYFRNTFLLSVFSMMGYIVITYVFLAETRLYYLERSQVQLSAFFGFFFGVTKFVEFVVKTFVSGKLLEKHGIKFGLALVPLIVGIFGLLAVLASVTSSFNAQSKVLFVLIAISQLLYVVARLSVEIPAINMLFQPLKGVEKTEIQAMANGKGRQVGAILAGVLLLGLNFIPNSTPIFLGLLLLILISLFWLKYAFIVTRVYKIFLRKKLNESKANTTISKYQYSVKSRIFFLLKSSKKNYRVSPQILMALLFPGYKIVIDKDAYADINPAVRNSKYDQADSLLANWDEGSYGLLLELISDTDWMFVEYLVVKFYDKIQSEAFEKYIDGAVNTPLSNRLFILLIIKNYSGPYIEAELKRHHRNELYSKNKHFELLRLVELIGNVKNERHTETLLEILITENIEIKFYALTAINRIKPAISSEYKAKIKTVVISEVKYYTWIVATIVDLESEDSLKDLCELLEMELKFVRNMVFDLLRVIYLDKDLEKIKHIVHDEQLEDLPVALEIIEMLLEDDLTEFVLPIIEGLMLDYRSQLEKLEKLFMQRKMTAPERLNYIISIDHRNLNDWIRICAIDAVTDLQKGLSPEIESLLFSTNLVLKETAYVNIQKVDYARFDKFLSLEKNSAAVESVTNIFKKGSKQYLTSMEIVNILGRSDYFRNVSKSKLLRLSSHCDKHLLSNRNIESRLLPEFFYVVVSGVIKIETPKDTRQYEANEIIGLEDDFLRFYHTIDNTSDYQLLKVNAQSFAEMATILPDFIVPLTA